MEKRRFRVITLLADIVFLTVSFLVMIWTKPASLKSYLPSHTPFFILLALIWIVVSLVNGKMHRHKVINFTTLFTRVLTSNIIAISLTALIMYSTREYTFSRTIVLGTAVLTTFLELLFGSMYMAYKKAVICVSPAPQALFILLSNSLTLFLHSLIFDSHLPTLKS